MTRIGINPARHKTSDYRPAKATVAVLTHIPQLSGYFRQRLEVLRLSLSSILANTTAPYDLLVFDNGSCTEVVDYLRSLRDAGVVRFLMLSSQNIGKIGALRMIFESAPGEYVAYGDEDILYYPGWLEAELHLFEAFPQAGMVSGVPVRNASRYATQSLQQLVEHHPDDMTILPERRIPDEWEVDWAVSTGRDPQEHLQALKDHIELVLCRAGVEAIGSANHFQFIAPKQVMLQALPKEWSGRMMGQMVELDQAIDSGGYLRLSTVARYTRHIGNIVGPELLAETHEMGIEADRTITPQITRRRHWLMRLPGSQRILRRILLALYDRMFNLLYEIE